MKRFLAIALCLCLMIGMTVVAMADTVPTDTVPTDTVPTDTVPTDTVPTDTVPTDTVPTDTVPTDTVPTDTVPTDTVPTDTVPDDTDPTVVPGGSTAGGSTAGGSTADDNTVDVNDFTDVNEAAYYYDALAWAVENGITNGTTETTFSPNAGCTRGQMVSFLWRAAGCPEPKSTSHNFTDIDENAHYFKALLWAIEEGITNGTTATTFSPSKICTRAQMAAFLYRHAGSPAIGGDHAFTDVNENAYYNAAVAWALDNGITNGTTTTTYSPSNNCSRAQMVTFLYRYFAE